MLDLEGRFLKEKHVMRRKKEKRISSLSRFPRATL